MADIADILGGEKDDNTITVSLGQLAKELKEMKLNKGTTLIQCLNGLGIDYGASVRVNAEVRDENYILQDGDIITVIGQVSGGY